MTIYQIKVTGSSTTSNDVFKCFSQKVYREPPTEEEIKKFVEVCANNERYINALDLNKDYEVTILELDLTVEYANQ